VTPNQPQIDLHSLLIVADNNSTGLRVGDGSDGDEPAENLDRGGIAALGGSEWV